MDEKKKRLARSGPQFQPGEHFTDSQLMKRWQCSAMKLWRMRQKGLLRSFKAGGTGPNLTPASVVESLEGGSNASAS